MKSPVLATAAILMVVVCTVMADARKACRPGYTAVGKKCYRFVKDKLDWNSAAVNCGADGATLARYDSYDDRSLDSFFSRKTHLMISNVQTIHCSAGQQCVIPNHRVGISVKVKHTHQVAACKGKVHLSCDRSKVVVRAGCPATLFVVGTLGRAWIGGNSNVLNVNQRRNKIPFQVDPPRFPGVNTDAKGCFQASYSNSLLLSTNRHCEAKLPSVCSYDPHVSKEYDPLDFVLISERLTYDEAVIKCNKLNRPIASIKSAEQQKKLEEMTKEKAYVWLSAKYDKEAKKFKWEDGTFLGYTNFQEDSINVVRGWSEHFCLRTDKHTGKWDSVYCPSKWFALCGPKEETTPLVFTKNFKVDGTKSVPELKEQLLLLQKKDFVCEKPKVVVCSAKSKRNNRWITNNNQASNTLKCTRNNISCKNNKEVDCSTLHVKFLCPQEVNQCKELKRLNAQACSGGQQCYPVSNHYTCRCPAGSIYSQRQERCIKFCGECSSWGDPHVTTYSGIRYDFMGNCTYKYSGVCNKAEFGNRPNFDVYTTHERCINQARNDGTCVSGVEIKLRNIPVTSLSGAKETKDFVFKVSVRSNYYTLNGEKVTDQLIEKEGVYKATVRPWVFSLTVYALDLKVFLNGISVRVHAPETFKGKMCGLCGDCGTTKFRLRSGKSLDIKRHAGGLWYDTEEMKVAGIDWLVKDKESEGKKCGIIDVKKSTCSKALKNKARSDSLCGVFLKNKVLQECFQKTNFVRDHYLWGCVYDVCHTKDPAAAVCEVVKTFAQKCMSKGVMLNWRTPSFCPSKCPAGMDYRVDASCQRECGAQPGKQGTCDEEPAEGCVCKHGLYRQGNKCVQQHQCGCRVLDYEGNFVKTLQPGGSVVLPGCREKVICEKRSDGSLKKRHVDYRLPDYAVCSDDLPPKITCGRGARTVATTPEVKCEKITKCSNNFKDQYSVGVCIKRQCGTHHWAEASKLCSQVSGTLVYVDTEQKIEAIKGILKQEYWGFMYVAGKVKAFYKSGAVVFRHVPSRDKRSSIAYANAQFHCAFLQDLVLAKDIVADQIPKEGLELGVVAELVNGGLVLKAVKTNMPANFVCEQFS